MMRRIVINVRSSLCLARAKRCRIGPVLATPVGHAARVVAFLACTLLAVGASRTGRAAGVVNVYSWSNYIAASTIPQFEARTGIHVRYDTFDDNDTLDAKLKAGHTGYDIVVPSMMPYLADQIRAGALRPLDRSKLPNWPNLDPAILRRMEVADPGNRYAVPWMTGTDGIAINVAEVHAIMPDAPVDSLRLLFDPKILSRFRSCGVSFLDSEEDVIPEALIFLGIDPNTTDPAEIRRAAEVFAPIRPFIRKFDSSGYVNDLANGDLCIAFGWSTDIEQARRRAREAGHGVVIAYHIPREGSQRWIDTIAIPRDAPDFDDALAWMNFLMDPHVIAANSNALGVANGNAASTPFLSAAIRDDPGITPPASVERTLYTPIPRPLALRHLMTRVWTRIKTGE